MKTAPVSRLTRRAAWTFGAVLLLIGQAVQACPGCKQATDGPNAPPLNGDSIGFGLSIFFMLFMILAVMGGLGFMMYRSCRALAARDARQMAELEAEEGIAPAARAVVAAPAPGNWGGVLAHGRA